MEENNNLEELEKELIIKSQEERVLRKRVEILRHKQRFDSFNNYVGKRYRYTQYNDTWTTFIYVNKLNEKVMRLYCYEFTFRYDKINDNIDFVIDSDCDFSSSYLTFNYEEYQKISDCVEVTKENFLEAHQELIKLINDSIK